MTTEQRRLAAILVADVVGYSKLMGSDEAGTLAQLEALRTEIIEPQIAKHAGRLFKSVGDGFLIEFASAVQAVSCAKAIQEANDLGRLPLRIGIHVGDVVVQGDDLMGDGVNVAARVEGIAEPGGIAITRAVHEQVRDKLDLDFMNKGEIELKNIQRPVQVFVMGGRKVDGQATVLPLPDKPSIAVLPFQNMSGDPEQEYFADGMVEEIITALSRFRSLFVIARNSSFTYKGKAVDIKQVGRELGVRYVLEGSVRKAPNRVRITAQLIDTESGAHIWADRFDGPMEDVFELQDLVTAKVVGVIGPKLQQSDIERARRKPTEKMDAYDCFLRGMAAVFDRSKWSTSEARDWYRRAMDLDPAYAAALAMCAYTIQFKAISHGVPLASDERIEALELVESACKLASDDGAVLARAAQVLCYTGRQYDRANSLIEDAIELNPNDARIWAVRGWIKNMCDQPDRAIESFERTLILNPMDPMRGTSWNGMAFSYFLLGQYDKGAELAAKSVELVADAHSLPLLVALEVRTNQLEDAQRHALQLMNSRPDFRASHSHDLFPVRSPAFHQIWTASLREAGLPE